MRYPSQGRVYPPKNSVPQDLRLTSSDESLTHEVMSRLGHSHEEAIENLIITDGASFV